MGFTSLRGLSAEVGQLLVQRGWQISCAESCTGGTVAAAITEIYGSSAYFSYGLVTYSAKAKRELLGVREETLVLWGGVSEQVACEMVRGIQRLSGSQIAVALTGTAGPNGGTPENPVGTVCFAWADKNGYISSQRRRFWGDRAAVRRQATFYILMIVRCKLLSS